VSKPRPVAGKKLALSNWYAPPPMLFSVIGSANVKLMLESERYHCAKAASLVVTVLAMRIGFFSLSSVFITMPVWAPL
jgi:hypothetical protein